MGKVRVHELAKEYGLENKDVVQRLQAAGISVKTHSSSVYEDEARAALDKHKTGAPPAAAPAARAGMVIVRKAAVIARERDEAELAAASEAQAAAEREQEAAESAALAEAEAQAEAEASRGQEEDEDEGYEYADEDGEAVAVEEQLAHAPEALAAAPAEGEAAAPQSPDAVRAEAGPAPVAKQQPGSARVVRMIDREKLLERLPARRLGGAPRPAAPGTAHAAAGQRFGRVTELQVVTDPFGRGREMVDVARDKKGKPGKATKKSRAPTKREMMEMRERAMHPARLKKKKTVKRATRKTELTQPKASKRIVKMRETITVADLAHQLGIKAYEIVQKLMGLGTMVNINGSVGFDAAQLVAAEYEYTVDSQAFAEDAAIETGHTEEVPEDVVQRPPVVTVMGHVDHGKTSLLDAIRKTHVAKGEAGGITQHIGAYQVALKGRGTITFLDTPGHAAFTSMRARGAQVTDIVVLVVAADDGVMPQTQEAIRHAQAAEVPIIVAVNKIDKPEANAERVMQELTKFELLSEAWGGETQFVSTSATKGTGIKELLEAILLQAEMLELRANPTRPAVGVVVEAQLDKGRGPVATILVQQGTLKQGDAVVVGESSGKIRAMTDDQGRVVKEAGPSAAVEILGLDAVPAAGDLLNAVATADIAREVAQHRIDQKRAEEGGGRAKMSLEDMMNRMKGNETLELKVVLKADVQGSVEAVRDAMLKLSTDEVKVNVIYGGVGAVSESDIMLASASDGIVIGFGVRPDSNARSVAEREGVEIRTYNIIYELLDEVRKAMEGLLTPESREQVVGRAEVREVFNITKVGTIAGCRVVEGKAMRAARVRLLRDSVQVFDGKVASLKHFKNDAREVESGLECGVSLEGFNDIKANDVIEFYQVEQIARKLDSPPSNRRPPRGGAEAHP